MALSIFSILFTICVFGQIGWIVASQRENRSGVRSFAALFVIAAVGFLIGGNTIVFGIDKFSMLLNWVSVSACAGAGLRLALTNRQLKKVSA